MSIPKEPIIFIKANSSISGPNDNVVIPKNSKKTDWEVELGIIVGKKAQYISIEDSLQHIFGYCIVNEIFSIESDSLSLNLLFIFCISFHYELHSTSYNSPTVNNEI